MIGDLIEIDRCGICVVIDEYPTQIEFKNGFEMETKELVTQLFFSSKTGFCKEWTHYSFCSNDLINRLPCKCHGEWYNVIYRWSANNE